MAVSTERDPVVTRAALADWLGRQTGATSVAVGDLTIPGLSGFSNETLLFEATWDGEVHPLVIRVEPTGHTVFPSTAFDAQVRVMQALHAEGSVPVPEVRWFEEGTDVLGARFVCMARVEGDVPADNPGYHGEGWMPALDEAGQRRVWESGLDTMAAIHRLDRGRHRARLDRRRQSPRAAASSIASTAPSPAARSRTPWWTAPSSSSPRASRPPALAPRCAGATPASGT